MEAVCKASEACCLRVCQLMALRCAATPYRPPRCMDVRERVLLWLSCWLSVAWRLAGMDGNRTHPGRLSSAPQTVLKTAGLAFTTVRQRPPEFDR